jgi:putative proteasome-type protease
LTYCLAIRVDRGLSFASDSRTNAGADDVSTFSKMNTLEQHGERPIDHVVGIAGQGTY